MTTSPLDVRPAARLRLVPDALTSAGPEAVDLAASAGLDMDPWQAEVVHDFLTERADGKWAALECGLIVPRQNGKSRALEAIALHALFLDPDAHLILWSAHQFKTAREAFLNLRAMVTNYDHLRRLVKAVRASHGEEGIELTSGDRLNFVARSRTSGRGFSGDRLILDEAQEIDPEDLASSLPMLSARPNPQLIYAGTVSATAEHLRRVRDRAEAGGEPRLAVTEYGADPEADRDDPMTWASANPNYGVRLDPEFVAMERKALTPQDFDAERLGIWPPRASEVTVFPADAWEACADPESVLPDPFVLSADAPPDRSEAYIAAAGPDHVEIVETKRGLTWVADYLISRYQRHNCLIVLDAKGALGSIVPRLEAAGVRLLLMGPRDVAAACGQFYDAVTERRLHHLDDPLLNVSVAGASQRPLGDAWAWDRKHATVPLSPLIAATNALWGANQGPPDYDPLQSVF